MNMKHTLKITVLNIFGLVLTRPAIHAQEAIHPAIEESRPTPPEGGCPRDGGNAVANRTYAWASNGWTASSAIIVGLALSGAFVAMSPIACMQSSEAGGAR
jgi:hypothetical protein